MKRIVSLLLFCLPIIVFSQAVRSPISANYTGLGSYSNNHVDVFSFQDNQACLAKIRNAMAGIYGEKRFLLNELGLYDVALAIPTSSGNFGLDARYFGFSDYNESQLGLAYARSLGKKIDIGVQFNYYDVRIAGYGSAPTINFELGTIFHLTDNLNAGLHVYNPVAGKLGKDGEEKLASIYSVGLGYEASGKFFISLEIQKEENKPVDVKAGLQYKFLPQLMARCGISSNSSVMFLGIGFEWKLMRLDATAGYHPQLGITPGMLLIFNLSKRKENN